MQISKPSLGPSGPTNHAFQGGVAAAAALLNEPAEASGVGLQLKAYQALAGRWREGGHGERAILAEALTESPFARQVQATLNAFTRAAWAGPDAAPPAPQVRILKAFDSLSDVDRQIVAAMQVDGSGARAFASANDYRARLLADLEAAELSLASGGRRADTITLSDEARSRLAAGSPDQDPDPPRSAEFVRHPVLSAAIEAYSRPAGGPG